MANTMIQSSNRLLDANDLSTQTGWSVSTIYRRRSVGASMPRAIKVGRALRWRQSDVDAWIEEQLEPGKR